MGIGENTRRLRRREGLTQAQFAARLGVAKETVSRWEGNRTFLRRSHVERMVAEFSVSVDDILSDDVGLGSAPEPQNLRRAMGDGRPHGEHGGETAGAPGRPRGAGGESCARDARGRAVAEADPCRNDVPADAAAASRPVYKVDRSGNGTTLRHAGCAFAPPDVAARHPASIFVRMDYREMTRLYPVGCLLLVDQRARPFNGCTVVALVDNATIVIRRYTAGNHTVVLSSWSHDAPSPDLMLDKRRVHIIGVAVFFQASHDTEVP